jgi:4-amino-4-deoxychorismate lyase
MSLLVETIKIEDGNMMNIHFHNERMKKSLYGVLGLINEPDIENTITIPSYACKGIYKCRIEYDSQIRKTEFSPYIIRHVRSLKLVWDDNISYPYKYADRDCINKLTELREDCDEILIIRKGMVTDSSYANVVFRNINGTWETPSTYLLPGTRRENLLQQGLISETRISANDIYLYTEVKLINAMLGLKETEGISVRNIL